MYYHIQLFIEVFGDIAALGLNLYNNKHNIVFNFILLVIQFRLISMLNRIWQATQYLMYIE